MDYILIFIKIEKFIEYLIILREKEKEFIKIFIIMEM
jgi:hypothetical protein